MKKKLQEHLVLLMSVDKIYARIIVHNRVQEFACADYTGR